MEEKYESLQILRKSPNSGVFNLILNRPSRCNALSLDFFNELPKALLKLDENPDTAVIVLSGAGDHFCSGVDLKFLSSVINDNPSDRGRAGERLHRKLLWFQDTITAIERCRKPVIASISGACIGVGIDLVAACDIRYCSKDAFFLMKEIDLAVVADLGILQRLPGIVGTGKAMELALTGRTFSGSEAKELGLVSRVFGSREELNEGVNRIAEEIASKSPLAVTGTKAVLLKSRDMSLAQGLDYIATWNTSMLLSHDVNEAISAQLQKRKPNFSKL